MRPLGGGGQSHSGSVAALQDEIPILQLRVTVRAIHLHVVVIRIFPPSEFATDQTATVVTVLHDVPDWIFVHLGNHHPPGPNPLIVVNEPKVFSRWMYDGRDCGHL